MILFFYMSSTMFKQIKHKEYTENTQRNSSVTIFSLYYLYNLSDRPQWVLQLEQCCPHAVLGGRVRWAGSLAFNTHL